MIRADQAHKTYNRNTPVIRKGDKGWTSDNHHEGRWNESYGTNPWSRQDQKIRQTQSRAYDESLLPREDSYALGDVVTIQQGRDLLAFRLTIAGWKYSWRERNAAV